MLKVFRKMEFEAPKGFSLCTHGEYSIILRDDLHRRCCDLVIGLAREPAAQRGKVLITPFPSVDGEIVLAAFRRTVRGGPYRRLGLQHTFGFTPRTFTELTVAACAEQNGAPVVAPLGCYWKRGAAGVGYTSGYFSIYQEKALCLGELLDGWRRTSPPLIRRRQVLSRFAQALKQLHRIGVVHTDLTVRNVLVGPGDQCLFVDLDGAFTVRSVSDASRISTLSRLNRSLEKSELGALVSVRDRLWFLKEYLGPLRGNKVLVRHIMKRATRDLQLHRLFWSRNHRPS